jgi:hypothetical protein
MQDTDPLYQYVRQVMIEIMAVLWANGQTTLHVGAVMRLLGVPEEAAKMHDDERLDIADSEQELMQALRMRSSPDNQVPSGTTIH